MLPTDDLYVAATKPAMKMGVTYEGWRANVILTVLATVIVVQNPLGFATGIAVHFILRELCRVDPHFFRRWTLFSRTKMRSATRAIWGGSRLDPSRIRATRAAEVMTCV